MKRLYLVLSIFVPLCCSQTISTFANNIPLNKSQLDSMFYDVWNTSDSQIFEIANTAKYEDYLTNSEKDIFLYLNLARLDPPLFATTYVAHYDGIRGIPKGYGFDERKKSLIEELILLKPLNLLYPDKTIHEYARCFATEAGKAGTIGHAREGMLCDHLFHECCTYRITNGLDIVMSLLIDMGENNGDLGHRKICLGSFGILGVSIQPHIITNYNAVLNFGYNPDQIYEYMVTENASYRGTRDITGKLDGKGVLTADGGYRYEGEWKDSKMQGYGILCMRNGCRYEGEWLENEMHGYGIYYQNDGSMYGGQWVKGELHGKITYFTKFGTEYEGEFSYGEVVKEWTLVTDSRKSGKEEFEKKKNMINTAVISPDRSPSF